MWRGDPLWRVCITTLINIGDNMKISGEQKQILRPLLLMPIILFLPVLLLETNITYFLAFFTGIPIFIYVLVTKTEPKADYYYAFLLLYLLITWILYEYNIDYKKIRIFLYMYSIIQAIIAWLFVIGTHFVI